VTMTMSMEEVRKELPLDYMEVHGGSLWESFQCGLPGLRVWCRHSTASFPSVSRNSAAITSAVLQTIPPSLPFSITHSSATSKLVTGLLKHSASKVIVTIWKGVEGASSLKD
jgi:hypothetical protein